MTLIPPYYGAVIIVVLNGETWLSYSKSIWSLQESQDNNYYQEEQQQQKQELQTTSEMI